MCHALGMSATDSLEICSSPSVTLPNSVAVGQTIWAYMGFPKNVGDASALPLGMVACLTPTKIPLPHVQPCQIWSFSVK